jgi:23S rRNA pseudouridine1911/1915/1917 synthase
VPPSEPSLVISRREAGRTLADVLRGRLRLSFPEARRLVCGRRVWLGGKPCTDPARRVKPGQRLEVRSAKFPARPKKPRKKSGLVLRFVDDDLVAVDKPAGVTTMRHPDEAAEFGRRAHRYLPPTLADRLPDLLAGGRPGPRPRVRAVHRLDLDTSGLVVFARTPEAERHLGRQFRAHTIDRRYLAIVRGEAVSGRIESRLVRDRGDGRRGSTTAAGDGKRAVTQVRVVEELGDYTLVECRLETGRTHQVRIHLAESGTPLCGERVYDRPVHGRPLPDGSGFGRPALHAAHLGLEHPRTGKHLSWTSPLPRDMQGLLTRLRGAASGRAP